MRAELDDAPDYFLARRKKNGIASVVHWLAGTVISLGILYIFSNLVLGQAVKNLSSQKTTLTPKAEAIGEIYRPKPEAKSEIDWDSVVQEKAQRSEVPQPRKVETKSEQTKQTVFNDRNYNPQGAINIVQAERIQPTKAVEQTKQKTEIVVVGKAERRLSDFCPYSPGSIEHRNCKATINLNSR